MNSHNHMLSSLLFNLTALPLTATQNLWLFENDDTQLVLSIQQAVQRIATEWAKKQSISTIRRLHIRHSPIGAVLGRDVVRKCLGYLSSPDNHALYVPANDHLSSSIIVNREWNSLATTLRFKRMESHGIVLTDSIYLNESWEFTDEWVESAGRLFARLNLTQLYLREWWEWALDQDTHLFHRVLEAAHRYNTNMNIERIHFFNTEHTDFFQQMIAQFDMFENVKSIRYEDDFGNVGESACNFLRKLRTARREVLEELRVDLIHEGGETLFDSVAFNEIPDLLPPSIRIFSIPTIHWWRGHGDVLEIPQHWIISVIRFLPNLEILTYRKEKTRGFRTPLKEHVLERICEKTTLRCVEVYVADDVSHYVLGDFMKKLIQNSEKLTRIEVLMKDVGIDGREKQERVRCEVGSVCSHFTLDFNEAKEDASLVRVEWVRTY